MGKNSGYNQVNQNIDQYQNEERQRYGDFNKFLEGIFGGAYGQGNDWMNDSYGKLNDVFGQYGNAARTGFGDEYRSRSFYDELMKTGGFTDKDKQEFRARAEAPTVGMYDTLKDAMATQSNINPYNVGFGGQMAKLARQKGQEITAADLGAETNLDQMIREGRLAGAAGETGIAGAINANKFQGMSGEAGVAGTMGQMGEFKLSFAGRIIDGMLANASLDASTRENLLRLKAQLNPKVSGWERAMQIAGIVTGGISTAVGIGRSGGKNSNRQVQSGNQPYTPYMAPA